MRWTVHVASTTVAVLAALPAAASAQAPTTPPPAAAPPTVKLVVEKAGPKTTVLKGSRVRLRITQSVFTPNTRVKIRVFRGGKKAEVKGVTLQPAAAGTGQALLSYTASMTGRLTLRVVSGVLQGKPKRLEVLPRRVTSRSSPSSVRLLQRKLAAHGYVVGKRGSWDARTARAVLAFRKVTGMARTSEANVAMMRKVARGAGGFRVRFPGHGRHVEADLSRQVMVFVGADRKVERIYHVSTGKPSTPTIRGSFSVYRKDYGTNAIGMIDAAYFIRGYAIHGYKSVPTYPASAGCLRVPPADARSIANWVRHGTKVDVYA